MSAETAVSGMTFRGLQVCRGPQARLGQHGWRPSGTGRASLKPLPWVHPSWQTGDRPWRARGTQEACTPRRQLRKARAP